MVKAAKTPEFRFTKSQLLANKALTGAQRDQLQVALKSDEAYTLDQAKAEVNALKGELL